MALPSPYTIPLTNPPPVLFTTKILQKLKRKLTPFITGGFFCHTEILDKAGEMIIMDDVSRKDLL